MSGETDIPWCDWTLNPIVGCSKVTPGCAGCYAIGQAHRLASNPRTPHYAGTTRVSGGKRQWTGKVALAPDSVLAQPLRRRRATTYFVNSMGDVWHEDVPDDWVDRVFALPALSPQHTFLFLTKRAARMRAYFEERWQGTPPRVVMGQHLPAGPETGRREQVYEACEDTIACFDLVWPDRLLSQWPLPNVVLGVSVEDQQRADDRREDLAALAAQGWRTFASYEPALGPVDWAGWSFLDGLISGGESGPGARPSHPDWHRAARDWCTAHGIAYSLKQWGEWAPGGWFDTGDGARFTPDDPSTPIPDLSDHDRWSDRVEWFDADQAPDGPGAVRVGRARAGRLLDGHTHDALAWPVWRDGVRVPAAGGREAAA